MPVQRFTVVGARGFVGSRLTQTLREQRRDVLALGRGDLDFQPERHLGHVIYAAGLTADFRQRPLDTVQAHVCTLRRLLERGRFDSLTYLSSTRVYAGAASTQESANLQVNPNVSGDLYNLSKLMGESLCLHGGRTGVKIARLSNVVGLRPDPDIFIDQLLAEGRAHGGRVSLKTSLDSCKDYIALDDAVALLIRLSESSEAGIFNVASGEATSNAQVVDMIQSQLGYVFEVAPDATRWAFDPIDINRVHKAFGFRPQAFADYFSQFLQDYQAQRLMA